MKFLSFFHREADFPLGPLALTLVVAAVSACGLVMLAVIASGQTARQAEGHFFLFLTLFGLWGFAEHYATTHLVAAWQTIAAKVRARLIDRIRQADYRFLEQHGEVALTEPVLRATRSLSDAALELTWLVQSALLALLSLAVLGWISSPSFILYCGFLLLASALYFGDEAARRTDALDEQDPRARLRDFFSGLIPYKHNRLLSEAWQGEFNEAVSRETSQSLSVGQRQGLYLVMTRAIFWGVLGIVVFALPMLGTQSSQQMIGAMVFNLLLLASLGVVVGLLPRLEQVHRALDQLDQWEQRLTEAREPESPIQAVKPFQSIALRDIGFTYLDVQGNRLFSLRGLSLELKPGELVLIHGPNGSGKTTLLKVIAGLYPPQQGYVEWNGKGVKPADRPRYRQQFASVFHDFPILDWMLNLPDPAAEGMEDWFHQLHLPSPVPRVDQATSKVGLSTGEQRRLAFAVACFQDKPIVLFDELGADQDARFRHRFYRHLLPALKAQGKTILVATRDDQYLAVADQVIQLNLGVAIPTPAGE